MADGRRPVRELPSLPPLSRTYVRAVRQRPGDPGRVPEHALRVAGVVPEPDRVAAYANLVGERVGSALPPLFPHLLGFPLHLALLTDPQSPFPAMGLVHVRNEVTITGPVPFGAPLDVEVEMEPPRPHRRGRTVDLLARVQLEGSTVWSSTSTYLRRGTPAEGAAPATVEGSGPEPTTVGFWRLPADLGRRYGAVSGDRNPIHLSALTARAFGFPRPIAHGMWTAARCLAALEGRLPTAYRADVEFRAPVPLPGTVEFRDLVGEKDVRFELRAPGEDRVHLLGSVVPL